jgi:hypothetical protein
MTLDEDDFYFFSRVLRSVEILAAVQQAKQQP